MALMNEYIDGVKSGSSCNVLRAFITFFGTFLTGCHIAREIFPALPDMSYDSTVFFLDSAICLGIAGVLLSVDAVFNAKRNDKGHEADKHYGPLATDVSTFSYLVAIAAYAGRAFLQ